MKVDKDSYWDALIDQAIKEFPLEPPPQDLMARIMGQIQRPLAVRRFKISWMDLALSGAVALVFGFVLDFFQDVARSPYWSTRLQVGLISFWRETRYFLVQNQSPLLAALLSAGVVLSLLAILASVYWRYAAQTNRVPA